MRRTSAALHGLKVTGDVLGGAVLAAWERFDCLHKVRELGVGGGRADAEVEVCDRGEKAGIESWRRERHAPLRIARACSGRGTRVPSGSCSTGSASPSLLLPVGSTEGRDEDGPDPEGSVTRSVSSSQCESTVSICMCGQGAVKTYCRFVLSRACCRSTRRRGGGCSARSRGSLSLSPRGTRTGTRWGTCWCGGRSLLWWSEDGLGLSFVEVSHHKTPELYRREHVPCWLHFR